MGPGAPRSGVARRRRGSSTAFTRSRAPASCSSHPAGQGFAAFPEGDRLVEAQPADLQRPDHLGELVAGLLVRRACGHVGPGLSGLVTGRSRCASLHHGGHGAVGDAHPQPRTRSRVGRRPQHRQGSAGRVGRRGRCTTAYPPARVAAGPSVVRRAARCPTSVARRSRPRVTLAPRAASRSRATSAWPSLQAAQRVCQHRPVSQCGEPAAPHGRPAATPRRAGSRGRRQASGLLAQVGSTDGRPRSGWRPRRSATRSTSGESGSCPIARTTGVRQPATARTQRFVGEGQQVLDDAAAAGEHDDVDLRVAVKRRRAPRRSGDRVAPCTATCSSRNRTAGQRAVGRCSPRRARRPTRDR